MSCIRLYFGYKSTHAMETNTTKKNLLGDEASVNQIMLALVKKGFKVTVLHSEKEVKDFITTNIPDERIVGLGDSITTCKLNIRNILAAKGSAIFYSWDGSDNYNRSLDTFEPPVRPDFYLTRINAITTAGEILLKDYSRNAVAGNLFPRQIFAFAGSNRVTEAFNDTESIVKYPVFNECPPNVAFTVVLLPFMVY
jgi:hypothetical protein